MDKKLYEAIQYDETLTQDQKRRKISTLYIKDLNRKKRAHQKLFSGSRIADGGVVHQKVVAKNLNYLRKKKII